MCFGNEKLRIALTFNVTNQLPDRLFAIKRWKRGIIQLFFALAYHAYTALSDLPTDSYAFLKQTIYFHVFSMLADATNMLMTNGVLFSRFTHLDTILKFLKLFKELSCVAIEQVYTVNILRSVAHSTIVASKFKINLFSLQLNPPTYNSTLTQAGAARHKEKTSITEFIVLRSSPVLQECNCSQYGSLAASNAIRVPPSLPPET